LATWHYAYWVDILVAEIVDHVGEELNKVSPKGCLLLVRQNVDTYRSVGMERRNQRSDQKRNAKQNSKQTPI
jgi:hypothetical protein